MTAYARAFARAADGITWSYPCLIWVSDYALDLTGNDPAERFRSWVWDERKSMRAMASAGRGMPGTSPVERALHDIAERCEWFEVEEPQGHCVGVYDLGEIGVPAIYDGASRWLVATADGAIVTAHAPKKIWRLPIA